MNFLAHTFLSCSDEKLLVGNFLGDFVKNKDLAGFPAEIQAGIFLHRKIDAFTDSHPAVMKAKTHLYEKHGKYAGVLVDIFFDHFLIVNWASYRKESLDAFFFRTYRIFINHLPVMPEHVQKILPAMIADNWLASYGTKEGILFAISRLQKRASKPELMDGAIESLETHFNSLDTCFQEFFPDVIKYVNETCLC